MYTQKFNEGRADDDKKSMLTFINNNSNLVDAYDIRELYYRVIAQKLEKDTGLYFRHETYGYFATDTFQDLKIKDYLPYDQILSEFRKFEMSTGLSKDDVEIKNHFKFMKSGFTYKGNGLMKRWGVYPSFKDLVYLLIYVVKGEIGKDYSEAIKIVDKYPELKTWEFPTGKFKIPEFRGIEIVSFKNGKIQIKGLSTEQENKIQHVFDIINQR